MRPVHVQQHQRGAVLIISLLFLVILTMLGVTAMTSTTFEERMAGNTRDTAVALNAAEAALRDARSEILGIELVPGKSRTASLGHISAFGPAAEDASGECIDGLCRPRKVLGADTGTVTLADIPVNVSWTGAPSVQYGTYTGAPPLLSASGTPLQQPRYVIELFCLLLPDGSMVGPGETCKVYRFTARGYGRNPNTHVTLQEIYFKESI
jgi:type IV pilus assembly protein PilX